MNQSDEATIREYYTGKGEQLMLHLIKSMLKDGMGQNEIDRLERDEAFKNEMIRTYIINQ